MVVLSTTIVLLILTHMGSPLSESEWHVHCSIPRSYPLSRVCSFLCNCLDPMFFLGEPSSHPPYMTVPQTIHWQCHSLLKQISSRQRVAAAPSAVKLARYHIISSSERSRAPACNAKNRGLLPKSSLLLTVGPFSAKYSASPWVHERRSD